VYDAIVVGARCAGAPTAMLLARMGHRVLLVDRATFPSDMLMSTHLVWQAGVAHLQSWGLLGKVQQTGCPPLPTMSLYLGPFTLTGSPPPVDGVADAYAPRRVVLDRILVEAAVEAGAELREECTVEEIVAEGGRVSGVRARDQHGGTFTAEATLVVGADGMNSAVARAVGAAEYRRRPPLQGSYFTYWSGVPMDGIELHMRPYRAVYGWLTNDDLALVGVNWTARDFPEVRADIEGHYFTVLDQVAPEVGERVRAGRREARWIGGAVPGFFRRSHGPGWALVGDAGYHKDPCTAQGITDAFRDAERLARAVDAGLAGRRPLENALAEYERERDEAVLPMYEFTGQLGTFEPPGPELEALLAAMRSDQPQTDRFFGVFAGTVPVQDFFAPENVERIVGRDR
jgi:2-polyprenyl-6-methoxyphenol hydroxylase-like FAD-dependent oxidoreductase